MPKFLILRFSSIGDIVLTTPVVRCLKQQVPGAEIHYLSRKSFEPVLRHNPFIDRLWLFDTSPGELARELKEEKYDAVIDLHHNIRTLQLKWSLNRPAFSFNKLNLEKWLRVNLRWDRLPDVHIVDRYLKTVSSWGVLNDGKGLDYGISDSDRVVLDRLPESHRNGFVAVAIGAQHATKRLPTEKLIGICRKVTRPIILLGGKEDERIGAAITEAVGPNVISYCGKISLNESAALVERAAVVLTHDTGLMHIAAAFKRPIVSVWGNTIPKFGMTPYYGDVDIPQQRFEIAGLGCRPCSKIGFEKCPKGHFRCMMNQDEEGISSSVNTL